MMDRRYAFCEALHGVVRGWPWSMEIVKRNATF
jgi:hypothetical protein